MNEGKNIGFFFYLFIIFYFYFYLELATLYKQCPGDREIEEYVKRIHALRQRMIEASIHVKIIEVNKIFPSEYFLHIFFHIGSGRKNGTINC